MYRCKMMMTRVVMVMAALTSGEICYADGGSVSVAGKPLTPMFATARPKGAGWQVIIRNEKEPCTGFFMPKGNNRVSVEVPNKLGKTTKPHASFHVHVDDSDAIIPGFGSLTVKTLTKTAMTIALDIKAENKTAAKQNYFQATITANICGPQ